MGIRRFLTILFFTLFLSACSNVMVPTPPPVTRESSDGTVGVAGPDGVVHVTGVSLDYSSIALTSVSAAQQLTAIVSPYNAANQGLQWASSNYAVASVTPGGLVTALSTGTAIITVLTADGGKTASCLINVSATGVANVPAFNLTPGNGSIVVSWTLPPVSPPPDIDYFWVSYTATGESGSQQINKTDSPNNTHTFTSLTNGKTYTVKIVTYYTDGTYSDEISKTATPAITIPDAALDLSSRVTAPVTAASAPTGSITSATEFTGTRSWRKEDNSTHTGVFNAGSAYKAVLVLTAQSSYTFYGVTPSAFTYIGATSVSAIIDTTNYKTATVTIIFPATAGVTIGGTITVGGADMTGVTVQLKSGALDALDSSGATIGPVTPAADGTYTISNVPAGTYTIVVSRPGYSPATIGPFSVTYSAITGQNASLTNQVTELNLADYAKLVAPVPNNSPSTAFHYDALTITQYTRGGIAWLTDGGVSVGTGTFQEGVVYKARFILTALAGWSFGGLTAADFTYSGATVQIVSNYGSQITIEIVFPSLVWTEVTVPAGTVASQILWIQTNGVPGNSYTVTAAADETIGTQTLNTVTNANHLANIRITIKGAPGPEKVLQLDPTGGRMFDVLGQGITSKITLVLENIKLAGISTNTQSLVYIGSSGVLILNTGAKITGNTTTSGSGGGVSVTGGSLTMNSGSEISGNRINISSSGNATGGGVYVSGTFTMNGGEISNNISTTTYYSGNSFGGGVYASSVSFTMNGGRISGNETNSPGSSGYSYGGGVYIGNSSSFIMSGGEISGNTTRGSNVAYGGGVYAAIGGLTMSGSALISGNKAQSGSGSAYGGGVYAYLTMNGGEISNNVAESLGAGSSRGGGVFSELIMTGGVIKGNHSASGDGGGVYAVSLNKTGGIIYGDSDNNHTTGADENTADTGNSHAVLLSNNNYRKTDAGTGVNLNSGVYTSPPWNQ